MHRPHHQENATAPRLSQAVQCSATLVGREFVSTVFICGRYSPSSVRLFHSLWRPTPRFSPRKALSSRCEILSPVKLPMQPFSDQDGSRNQMGEAHLIMWSRFTAIFLCCWSVLV